MFNLDLQEQIDKFKKGEHFYSYNLLGANITNKNKFRFAVWLPNVKSVSVVGDFNNWNRLINKMIYHNDVWICEIDNIKFNDTYNYSIETLDNNIILKTDPFGYYNKNDKTILFNILDYKWKDKKWFLDKKNTDINKSPINIYQLHLGSFKKYYNGDNLNYKDFISNLIPYIKKMGYTHIQIMPICEYKFENCLGYHTSNYYSPTHRYGNPHDLMELINSCHQNNIGVILDLVLSYFAKDYNALYNMNGLNCYGDLYDYTKDDYKNIKSFDFSKPEIHSFLISNVVYWLELYHLDGISITNVDSILNLDYNKKDFNTNYFGGVQNLHGIEFLQKLNKFIHKNYPKCLIISSNQTSSTLLTKNQNIGGLNFNFKWNEKFISDSLNYFASPKTKSTYNKLTTSFNNSFDENFILPISYKIFSNSKKTLISQMQGNYMEKFSSLRAYISFIMAFIGKKLIFMGQDIAQFIEWDIKKQIDWDLLQYPMHKKFNNFIKVINNIYIQNPSFWENEQNSNSFEWVLNNDYKNQIIAFKRIDSNQNEILVVCNFSNKVLYNYYLGISKFKKYKEIFNSDSIDFGGNGFKNKILIPINKPINGYNISIKLNLPPMSVLYLKDFDI